DCLPILNWYSVPGVRSVSSARKTLKSVSAYGFGVVGWVCRAPPLLGEKYTFVSAVSPRVPTHCTVMVVVGSRCQVRNSVLGWNAGSSVSFAASATGSAPNSRGEASVASEAPRNARRDGVNMGQAPGVRGGSMAGILTVARERRVTFARVFSLNHDRRP